MKKTPLPIDALVPEIVDQLQKTAALVLVASPGCGKSTRVPPALLEKVPGQILVLVPRRLAAKALSHRVSWELGEESGQTVGYHFRFEKRVSPATRLIFLTEGMLIRYLMSDPLLKKVSCVILDEFHERHLHTDVALGLLQQLKNLHRPDLKLMVMSATLDAQKIASYLQAPILQMDLPPFPVDILYKPLSDKETLEGKIASVVSTLTTQKNTLVFLPGIAIIKKTAQQLEKYADRFDIIILHGDLSKQEQNRVFESSTKPKIILSTNIAESSLTLPDIGTVIDSGLHRQASFSWWSGIPSLNTRPVSQASAIQRAGRAGRTSAGRAIRLYSEHDFKTRAVFEQPEIQRADLGQVLLEIKKIGLGNLETRLRIDPSTLKETKDDAATLLGNEISRGGFYRPEFHAGKNNLIVGPKGPSFFRYKRPLQERPPQEPLQEFAWYECPSQERLLSAARLLYRLGALERNELRSSLTDLGKQMAEMPLHPRLSRLVLEGQKQNCKEAATRLADQISEGTLPPGPLTLGTLSQGKASEGTVSQEVLTQEMMKTGTMEGVPVSVLFTAYPDQVAQVIGSHQRDLEVRFCQGGSAFLAGSDLKVGDFLIVLDVRETGFQGKKGQTRVFSYCPLPEEILWGKSDKDHPDDFLKEKTELYWNKTLERIEERTSLNYGELLLFEETAPCRHLDLGFDFLMKMMGLGSDYLKSPSFSWNDFLHKLTHWIDPLPLEEALARYFLFCEHHPSEDVLSIVDLVKKIFNGIINLKDLKNREWNLVLQQMVPPENAYQFGTELPACVHLPHRKNVKINYRLGQKPWIESKLQDFEGLQKTPSILGGKLLLNLHLLAPNKRPVQVTQDLESFWKKTYPELKPALSRRYPRHHWP